MEQLSTVADADASGAVAGGDGNVGTAVAGSADVGVKEWNASMPPVVPVQEKEKGKRDRENRDTDRPEGKSDC